MDFSLVPVKQLSALLDWRDIPLDLPSLAALAAGLGWASGLRLYGLVFILGALSRFAGVQLPGGLEVLAHPLVLGVSCLLLFVEFFADKIPWLDSVWDTFHTFIRIPAGAALAAAVFGDQSGAWQLAMGLMGGSLAATTHFAKAGTRALVNTSPEPVSNVITSLAEDGIFMGGMWMLLSHPILFLGALGVFIVLAIGVLVLLWKMGRRLFASKTAQRAPKPV